MIKCDLSDLSHPLGYTTFILCFSGRRGKYQQNLGIEDNSLRHFQIEECRTHRQSVEYSYVNVLQLFHEDEYVLMRQTLRNFSSNENLAIQQVVATSLRAKTIVAYSPNCVQLGINHQRGKMLPISNTSYSRFMDLHKTSPARISVPFPSNSPGHR